jgi:Rrf2 family protein
VRISAKTDYAVRAAIELAGGDEGRPLKAERIAESQDIPLNFLENILGQLRQARIVESRRGPEGGYMLARAAEEITVADVIRAIDGPLAGVGGRRPQDVKYTGPAESLRDVWVAVRASLRSVLEEVTLADVAGGKLPTRIGKLTADPDAWVTH